MVFCYAKRIGPVKVPAAILNNNKSAAVSLAQCVLFNYDNVWPTEINMQHEQPLLVTFAMKLNLGLAYSTKCKFSPETLCIIKSG